MDICKVEGCGRGLARYSKRFCGPHFIDHLCKTEKEKSLTSYVSQHIPNNGSAHEAIIGSGIDPWDTYSYVIAAIDIPEVIRTLRKIERAAMFYGCNEVWATIYLGQVDYEAIVAAGIVVHSPL